VPGAGSPSSELRPRTSPPQHVPRPAFTDFSRAVTPPIVWALADFSSDCPAPLFTAGNNARMPALFPNYCPALSMERTVFTLV